MASEKAKAYHYQVRRRQTQAPRRMTVGISPKGGSSGASEGSGAIEEGQQPIVDQGTIPRASIGNPGVGRIQLDSILSSRPNTAFDASAPIGGENVPYQPTSGVGGWFRRLLGDNSNMQNLAAQREQGAQMREDRLREEGMAREDAIRREGFDREDKRFSEDRNFRSSEAEKNRDQEYRLANERALADQFKSSAAEDRFRSESEEARRHNREVEALNRQKLESEAAKDLLPRFIPLGGGGGMFQQGGKFSELSPGVPGFGTIPGKPSSVRPVNPFDAPKPLPVWPGGATNGVVPPAAPALPTIPAESAPEVMPRVSVGGVMPIGERKPILLAEEEQSIDPYELARTTPNQGVLIDPITRRARVGRLLNPNTPAWKY